MDKDLRQLSGFTSTDLPPNTFTEVYDERPDDESPAIIPKAVVGRVEGKSGNIVWLNGVTDEASSCMRKESNHEEESKVVSIPKNLEALLSNFLVGSGIHQEHDEEHEVTGDAARLRIVNIQGSFFANFC